MQFCPFPIREAHPPAPLPGDLLDPASEATFKDPVLTVSNIQGSILTGFNKSHRILLFLKIDYAKIVGFKKWLSSQIPFVATADEVIAFSRLFKSTRHRRKREGTVKSTWMNVAFSFRALKELNEEADQFRDTAFREGLANRSPSLNDPMDGPYSPSKWLIGGLNNEADVLILIEADDRDDMLQEVKRITDSIDAIRNNGIDPGLTVLFQDEGENLPPPLTGHEHFGFLDGVSQPGLRGLLSKYKRDVLTVRQNPKNRDNRNISGQIVPAQGKPGQDLIYPGEFVFGYPRQKSEQGPNGDPGDDSLAKDPFGEGPAGPKWAQDGSFLVFRRLRQDVGAFHRFLHDTAEKLGVKDPANASAPVLIGSRLVGRWPSGAPVARVPDEDNPALANDDCMNNHFEFQEDSNPIPKSPNELSQCTDDDKAFPPAVKDNHGLRCPFTAHIRKAYPRDDAPLDPKKPPPTDPHLDEGNTQTHRLLRRGMPYGPVSKSTPDSPVDDDVDRGLQFLAYQTSIENQFEFVTKNWVNAEDFKEMPASGGGHDPIIGQSSRKDRIRNFSITFPDPARPGEVKKSQVTTEEFAKKTGKTDWVLPTGGGYFFAPSISALENRLAK